MWVEGGNKYISHKMHILLCLYTTLVLEYVLPWLDGTYITTQSDPLSSLWDAEATCLYMSFLVSLFHGFHYLGTLDIPFCCSQSPCASHAHASIALPIVYNTFSSYISFCSKIFCILVHMLSSITYPVEHACFLSSWYLPDFSIQG